MEHLDAHSWQALQARRPEAVAHFREHLRTPCPVCQEFLQHTWGGEALEGGVDAALLSLAPPAPQPFDEEGYARVRRRRSPSRRARWLLAVAPAAVAALLVLVVLLPREQPAPLPEQGLKGHPALQLELSAVARTPAGGLVRLSPGQAVSPRDVLLFRYHATEHGAAVLARVAGGRTEVLGTFALLPGTHDLRADGELAGASLEEARGSVSFVLVARPGVQPPTQSQVEAALAAGEQARDGLTTRGVQVRVESEENGR